MNPNISAPSTFKESHLLLALAGIQFTHILDFMIMMPLGPQLLRAMDISSNEFAVLLSSYTFSAAISGVLASMYVDKFDRRKLLLWLYTGFIVATLACGLANGYASLLIARAAAGAFGGILGALVQTIVADVIPFERRGHAIGKIMAAFAVSTVAGVPLGLLLAEQFPFFGWRAPFLFIVICSLLVLAAAWRVTPTLRAHLDNPSTGHALKRFAALLREPAHLKAYAFIAVMMLSSFSVIPYIALYYTANLGMSDSFITLTYLAGGAATLFTSAQIGKLADRHGKLKIFRWVAVLAFIPILITTHLVPMPAWIILINASVFFVLVSGRMIPGMAMATAVPAPAVRGTFMSLGSSVQMGASGLAALLGGMIISNDSVGNLMHYNVVGYMAVGFGLVAIILAGKLNVAPETK